jgi:DNA polymerase family A
LPSFDFDRVTAHDFETCLIRPALQAPPPVCSSWATKDDAGIFAHRDMAAPFRQMVTDAADGKIWIVGHNWAYDACVALEWIDGIAEPLFAAYDRGHVLDTGIYERIAEIGRFTTRKILSLEVVGAAYGVEVTKDPEIRLGYGRLLGSPLSEYSEGQRQYPIDDAVNTRTLFERQLKRHGKHVNLADVAFLCRKQWWLQLTRNWGLKIDGTRVAQLRAAAEEQLSELRELAQESVIDLPILKGKRAGQIQSFPLLRVDGTRDMRALKAWVSRAYDGKPPITDTGETKIKDGEIEDETAAAAAGYVSTAAATLKESGDYCLEQFAEFGEWSAVLKKDVKMFETITLDGDVEIPRNGMPVHTKYGIADTTRSTSAKPNVQNPRKKEGIRECFVARPGCAIISVDHGGLELCTLAQVIVNLGIGRRMADKINEPMDLHCDVAKEILGLSYAETLARYQASDKDVKNKRNCAKVVNFGRPGFMGAPTLVHYAKHSYKVDFNKIAEGGDGLGFAKQLIRHWETANPEGKEFLNYAKRLPEGGGGKMVVIPGSTIMRRGATVAAGANTHFQGLGAILEAYVGWVITREIFTGSGPLAKSGARMVNFVHDEMLVECPLEWLTEVAAQLEHIMATAPQKYLPDVRISSEAVAMLRWSKNATRVERDGELVPWDLAA